MNLAELRADFLTELNRDDCTAAQANSFIVRAIRRISRDLRLPCMEVESVFTADPDPIDSILIPGDLVAPIDLLVPATIVGDGVSADGAEFGLKSMSYRQLQQFPSTGPALAYARLADKFYFRGRIPEGSYVKVVYYAASPSIDGDTTETPLMAAAPELILYGALAYAGPVFEHPMTSSWVTAFTDAATATDQQARDLDALGGPMTVAAAYEG